MIKLIIAPRCENCEFFNPELNTLELSRPEGQSRFDHYITCIHERFCSEKEHKIAKEILLRLHNTGGCGAKEAYVKGWDEAITEAIRIVEDSSGVSIEEVI